MLNEIIQGDCLDVLKDFSDGSVDLVLTDPPYGIGWNTNYSRFSRGTADKTPILNDTQPFDPAPFLGYPVVVLFGANHYADKLPSGSWLIWDKRNPDGTSFLSDGEIAWCSKGRGVYIKSISAQWHRSVAGGLHPTQKPVALMEWILERYSSPNDLILDPFCGSGTTCVAAKKLGRRYIGIDISEEYCKIARERLRAVDTGVPVKESRSGQQALFA
jgi:DNA modification methylase